MGPLRTAKQPALVQQVKRDLRLRIHALLDGRRNGLPRLAAQPRLLMHQDRNAPQAAHLMRALRDRETYAQLLLHALLHLAQVRQAAQVFEPVEHLFLFGAREHQDAHIPIGCLQQRIPVADAGAGGAFGADGEGKGGHGAVRAAEECSAF